VSVGLCEGHFFFMLANSLKRKTSLLKQGVVLFLLIGIRGREEWGSGEREIFRDLYNKCPKKCLKKYLKVYF